MLCLSADVWRRGNVSTANGLQVHTDISFNLNGLCLSLWCALVFWARVLKVKADGDKSGMKAELDWSGVGIKSG